MKLNNKKLYDLLKKNGVSNLYHANTVATSITFIENDGVLSRESIENQGLYQTPQKSDGIDKLFDVFDDIFLDTTDLHKYFHRQNHYGPVMFEFNIDLVLDDRFEFWVTKDNPIYWNKESESPDNYFKSTEELSKDWGNYDIQKKMLTIKKPNQPILFEYLENIILDNPKVLINDNVSLRKESRQALKQITEAKPHLLDCISWRECGHCYCTDNYLGQVPTPELAQKFFLYITLNSRNNQLMK